MEFTPRRSQRINRAREATPDVETPFAEGKIRGPRMMAKLNRSKYNLNKTAQAEATEINITSSSNSEQSTRIDKSQVVSSSMFFLKSAIHLKHFFRKHLKSKLEKLHQKACFPSIIQVTRSAKAAVV